MVLLAEVKPVAEAKFLKAPVALFQAVGAVVNTAAVPKLVALELNLMLKPLGNPAPIPLKFSTYGDVVKVT